MAKEQEIPRLKLFPLTAEINKKDSLVIGGCDTVALAREYGTPLYVFDESDLRHRCREFKKEFGSRYPDTTVIYASKAFTCKAMVLLLQEEGLGLDVVSGGEIGIARSVGFPLEKAYFHGNNKSAEELKLALLWGIGRIVVDNFYELNMLRNITSRNGADILLRLTPGIDPHTHQFNTTGTVDSKFGFTLSTWDKAVSEALAAPNLRLVGLDFHLGSGIFEIEPYVMAVDSVLEYAAKVKKEHGFELQELDIGGGFGVQYVLEAEPPPISAFADCITGEIKLRCRELNLTPPNLIIEPGRGIVARAGVALYRVGAIKDIPGVRCYVAVDGGMGDNIRQPMYGARQLALVADRASAKEVSKVTIAGKYCESGDILIKDIDMPALKARDILVLAGSGAYCIPMSSNYNAAYRPAAVFVKDGKARLVRRRETLADLTRRDAI